MPSGWSFTTPLSLPKGRELAESCPELVEGMAETEFSVLARACLQGRNADEDSLERAVNARVSDRNSAAATIDWRFTANIDLTRH